MDAPVPAGYAAPDARTESVTLPARPEPLRLKLSETAVIVVDMQNAYATEGGYIDIAGFDVSGAPAAIANTKTTLDAARAAGLTVIFFQNGWDKDYVEAGTSGSPNFHKSNALKTMRARPELRGRCWRREPGTMRSSMRSRRNRATSSSPRRATAGSSTPTSTACCALGGSATWCSPG